MSTAKGKKRVENNRVKFPIGMTRAMPFNSSTGHISERKSESIRFNA